VKIWIKEILTTGLQVKGIQQKKRVVAAINKYKADMKSVLGTDVKYASIVKRLKVNLTFRMLKIKKVKR
jgi:hypothetical protein